MESKFKKNILIASGGTGGHLYPALVLAQSLKSLDCDITLTLGINPNRRTPLVLPLELKDVSYTLLPASPLRNIRSLVHNFFALIKAFSILNTFKPNCVVGFGSYASFPIILAAYIKRIPIVLHEQNLIPGWANKVASVLAKKVAISFPESSSYFPNKSILTGNLVRQEMFNSTIPKKDGFTLLVFGGSSGAKRLNQIILNVAPKLVPFKDKLNLIHVTGSQEDSRAVSSLLINLGIKNRVLDYAQEISQLYHEADLVLSRAGASTISELIATQTPAILIPYPHAVSNHQLKNGMLLSQMGSAIILPEDTENLEDRFLYLLLDFLENPHQLKKMKESYRSFPISLKEAPKKLAEVVISQCR